MHFCPSAKQPMKGIFICQKKGEVFLWIRKVVYGDHYLDCRGGVFAMNWQIYKPSLLIFMTRGEDNRSGYISP